MLHGLVLFLSLCGFIYSQLTQDNLPSLGIKCLLDAVDTKFYISRSVNSIEIQAQKSNCLLTIYVWTCKFENDKNLI
jgi:hypothetical protein